ncbi:MAG TPA: prepilin-type N-terminal cleavage/methylation domain-containing protein [Gammaproteobacteria bacterium]|nr:prepilin-type N-terminal cleavage/methylation domain-containing protein [Gammaproteobacteria bacterium]
MLNMKMKERGFTLLELLLVLALASILALGALSMYQIQLRNFKVDKTSLQMQQWLQAGMSFYVDCNQWPTDSKQDPNIVEAMMGEAPLTPQECPRYANTIRQYMPLNSDKNGPFPNDYSFGPVTSQNSTTLFQVSTDIGDDTPLLETVGKMIAARLPNAASSVDESTQPKKVAVQAMINVPGQALNQSGHGFILNMQMVPSTQMSSVKQPTQADCPKGLSPILVNAITNFEAQPPTMTHVNGGAMRTTTTSQVDPNSEKVTPTLTVFGRNTGLGGESQDSVDANEVLLISACIPNEGK